MRIVEISVAARRDVEYLRDWLKGRAPDASRRAVQTILAAAATLVEFPERGRLIRNHQRELTVRFSSTGYVLRYVIHPDRVTLSRVFHSLERR